MSQPSRALYIFLKISNIPFEACPVALRKGIKRLSFLYYQINKHCITGEHLTEEFKQNFSKFQTVPFIHDGEFRLAET